MLIKLSQGRYAKVDPQDYYRLNEQNWFAAESRGRLYATGHTSGKGGIKRRTIKMHKLILNAPKGLEIDHRNGDGLDNRRSNLRLGTHQQNTHNKISKKGRSKYKGVSFKKQTGKWGASIGVNYKRTHLGYFEKEVDAAIAYDKAAYQMMGEYARLNFPDLIKRENS